MTFLRVTDNGCGIPASELKTAFLRHATSKLRTEYDLEAIGTLGFRGEALAAISAVSRVEVMTRTQDSPLGASLSLEGGVPGPVEEAGCPLGTTMVVRDLFYNTPARLKFMKKDAAEGAAVFAVVQRVALSHPEVSVKSSRRCTPFWAGSWPWASPRSAAPGRIWRSPAMCPSPPAAGPAGTGSSSSSTAGR